MRSDIVNAGGRCGCRKSQESCTHSIIESTGTKIDIDKYKGAEAGMSNIAALGSYQRAGSGVTPQKVKWVHLNFESRQDKLEFDGYFEVMETLREIQRNAQALMKPNALGPARQWLTAKGLLSGNRKSATGETPSQIIQTGLGGPPRPTLEGGSFLLDKNQRPIESSNRTLSNREVDVPVSQPIDDKTSENRSEINGPVEQKEQEERKEAKPLIKSGTVDGPNLQDEVVSKRKTLAQDSPQKPEKYLEVAELNAGEIELNMKSKKYINMEDNATAANEPPAAVQTPEPASPPTFQAPLAGTNQQSSSAPPGRSIDVSMRPIQSARDKQEPKSGDHDSYKDLKVILRTGIRKQMTERISRKIAICMLWKQEHDSRPPPELWSSPTSFDFAEQTQPTPSDRIKGLFEAYSGQEWNWWPCGPRAKPLASGKVRIRWQCVSNANTSHGILTYEY